MFNTKRIRVLLFTMLFLFTVLICSPAALATDEDLLWQLPGSWIYTAELEESTEDLAILLLNPDGSMELRCGGSQGDRPYIYSGTWELSLTQEPSPEYGYNDEFYLNFTATDDPRHAGEDYRVECFYYIYAESWVEDSVRRTVLINEGQECTGVSPFEELCAEEGAALLHREEGPNMRVVKCKSYVSLRAERSTKAKRLVKVPLGAEVFAFPEVEEENGFLYCVYGEEYGYILTEYLQPIE